MLQSFRWAHITTTGQHCNQNIQRTHKPIEELLTNAGSGVFAAQIIVGLVFVHEAGLLLGCGVGSGVARHRKQSVHVHVESATELFESVDRNVLILILDAHDGGLRHANFTREVTLRNISSFFSNEICQSLPQMNHMWFII